MTPPRTVRQGKFRLVDHLVRVVRAPDGRLHLVRRTISEKRHAFTYATYCGLARLVTHRIAIDVWRYMARDRFDEDGNTCPECAEAFYNLPVGGPYFKDAPKKAKRTGADS